MTIFPEASRFDEAVADQFLEDLSISLEPVEQLRSGLRLGRELLVSREPEDNDVFHKQ